MADRPVVLRGARVVDPAGELDAVVDLRLADGRVAAVGEDLAEPGDRVVDVGGLVAAPGFCDMHVHFREPGLEYKETVGSGAAAAVAGGFTAVACMANTDPVNDSPSVTAHIRQLAEQAGLAHVHPIAATTQGMNGERISEFGALKEAGAVAVSDDGLPVGNPAVMRKALEYSRLHDLPVIEHCETLELTGDGAMREGAYAAWVGLPGIPAASEFIAVERNIALAEITGARLHIAHLSTERSAAAVRRAKAAGMRVTAEVTPHHLVLTEEAVGDYDTAAKMKPPLAADTDREALLTALGDGTADAIATDHAPHHADEKKLCFQSAPFGIVGLETAVQLVLDRLVASGAISLARAIRLLSPGPRRILGLPGGDLRPGSPADITLLDLEATGTINPESFRSRGRSTPFAGLSLKGQVAATWVGGREVYSRNAGR